MTVAKSPLEDHFVITVYLTKSAASSATQSAAEVEGMQKACCWSMLCDDHGECGHVRSSYAQTLIKA
jgi:hypothetical protein